MCELRALLPPDPAGAVQKRCGSGLPAPVLQPCEQVKRPCTGAGGTGTTGTKAKPRVLRMAL